MPLIVGYFLSILSFASPFRKCHKRSLVEETAELGVFFTSTNVESFSLFNVSWSISGQKIGLSRDVYRDFIRKILIKLEK